MSLSPGTRIGHYEVISLLGAGGMGEVFRARDTRLNREVAVKVLPALFASDQERAARFEREAQLLASLNHPHIAQVHGVVDSPPALVMELVEGDDLAERIAGGAIPVREALTMAAQILDALAAAHERGVIHRDLKPANVKVSDDGVVKVLDFGLAKALESPASSSAALMNSPTITSPAAMTRMGVILGTAAYMSPEQAKGRPADRSSDLWSFGAVLYEMLTGRAAFEGETVTDVLAAIVMRDPDWNALPASTPPPVARLLKRCLERDRRRRLADAGEARFQIDEGLSWTVAPAAPAASAAGGLRAWAPWAIAAALAIAVVVLAWPRAEGPVPNVTHVSLEAPHRAQLSTVTRPAISISADGRTVVFVAMSGGIDRLYVRRANEFDARLIEGTEGASNPSLAPDGRSVAFVAGAKLFKVSVEGGSRTEVADVADPRGVSWTSDDRILFTPSAVGGVYTVSPAGGAVQQLTTPVENQERTHRWAQLLPGGKAVIFTVGDFKNPDSYLGARIDAQVLATGMRRNLLTGAEMARYASTGHLVFARAGSLHAVPFDLESLEVGKTPVPVLHRVAGDLTTGAAHFDMSAGGLLAYIGSGGEQALTRPAWVSSDGRVEYLDVPAGVYTDPELSPDGRFVALSVVAGGGRDIWIYNFSRKTFTRASFGGQNVTPIWSRDGAWIYYAALGASTATIWRRAADGSRDAEPLVSLPHRVYLNTVSDDGKTATFDYSHAQSRGSDIGAIALVKDAKPYALIATVFDDYNSRVSPDGRWRAYENIETSRSEIYVQPADASRTGRWQVSTSGGREPKWSPDGRTLYYRYENAMWAVPILPGEAFQYGIPQRVLTDVYDTRIETGVVYDVHRDGRFLMIRLADENAVNTSIRLITNWFDELRKIGTRP